MKTKEEITRETKDFNTWNKCEEYDDGTRRFYHDDKYLATLVSEDQKPREDREMVNVVILIHPEEKPLSDAKSPNGTV